MPDDVPWFHSIDLDDPVLDFEQTGLVAGVYIALLSSVEVMNGVVEAVEIASKLRDKRTGEMHPTGYQRQRYEPSDPSGKIDWGKPSCDLGEAVAVGIYASFASTDPLWIGRFPGTYIKIRAGVIPTVGYSELRKFVADKDNSVPLHVKLSRERR